MPGRPLIRELRKASPDVLGQRLRDDVAGRRGRKGNGAVAYLPVVRRCFGLHQVKRLRHAYEIVPINRPKALTEHRPGSGS